MTKARAMLALRRSAMSTEMRDRYKSALDRYRSRFLKGYVDAHLPPVGEVSEKEKKDLRKESVRWFQGIIK